MSGYLMRKSMDGLQWNQENKMSGYMMYSQMYRRCCGREGSWESGNAQRICLK